MRILEAKTTIRHPPGAVWAVLADFGNVAKWAPGISRSRLIGDRKTGTGARRLLRHAWGFEIEECVTRWNEGIGYEFKLLKAPYPMVDVLETWQIEYVNHLSVITTTVGYDMLLGPVGNLLDKTLVRFIVAREMRAGLRGLERYLDQNSEVEATPVPRTAGPATARADP